MSQETPRIDSGCAHHQGASIYGGRLIRCAGCGMVITVLRPSFEYSDRYFTHDDRGGYDFDSAFARALDQARFHAELRRIERRGLCGRVLDIGCATGTFLEIARARGWDAVGVESAVFARERASARLGLPCVESLRQLPAGDTFDLVTLHHVLEHVADPMPFLRDEIAPRVGKLLLVEVPNFGSLASRVDGTGWRDLRLEQHVSHFEPATLSRSVSSAGFRVTRLYTLCDPFWTIRTALENLRHMGKAVLFTGRRHRDGQSPSSCSSPPPQLPSKFKALAGRLSFVALWPLIRGLEVARLAPRLVVEAEPMGVTSDAGTARQPRPEE